VPGLSLTTPVEKLPGVGPKRGLALRALGVRALAHLIDHLPFRHEREESESPIGDLVPGQLGAARGEVTACRVVRSGRPRFEAVLVDHTGRLDLVFFNQAYLAQRIVPGLRLLVQGKAQRFGPGGSGVRMTNPAWELLPERHEPAARGEKLRPVYPASEEISSKVIGSIIESVLDEALPLLEDHFDATELSELDMPTLPEAYRMMHRPADDSEPIAARRRLAYDELYFEQLAVARRRAELRASFTAPALPVDDAIDRRIRARFPFVFTEGQEAAIADLRADLAKTEPANRLIQGDVGSGKTAVALYAMLTAVAGGKQAAMLAPTEVLAEQHFAVISELLAGSRTKVELLTGSLAPADRARAAERVAAGEADIVIGTHALLSGDVAFDALAVAVIDEQHRFGVHQRAALKGKAAADGTVPHVIVMTATPIPRTLAMTVYGDLDVSVLAGRPGQRGAVETEWVEPAGAGRAWELVRAAASRGERSYIVLPAIDDGGSNPLFAAQGEKPPHGGFGEGDAGGGQRLRSVAWAMEELGSGPLSGLRLGAMHGRLARAERDAVMARFREGDIDVLVATTIVEVGVDVPEATVMVIDHAERFGIAQLHQIRGRVGRGDAPGRCVLIGDPVTPGAAERLRAVAETTDGFVLAEADLSQRGPGEMVGSRQSGLVAFRVASLPKDMELLSLARRRAGERIARSPALDEAGEALLRRRLDKRVGPGDGSVDVA
jgi:ATP-dependent DNA helicase RecG